MMNRPPIGPLIAGIVLVVVSCAPPQPRTKSAEIFTSPVALTLNDHASFTVMDPSYSITDD
jgi:hypothetical protein